MDAIHTSKNPTFSFPTTTTVSTVVSGGGAAGDGDRSLFCLLSDDVALNIFAKLEEDPRDWARLACVSTRIAALIRNVCCRANCVRSLPSLISDLGANHQVPACGWASLFKISVCCPGLLRAGILLENSDFGLEREIGPDENYLRRSPAPLPAPLASTSPPSQPPSDCWSLFDDLYSDTIYDISESQIPSPHLDNNNNNNNNNVVSDMPRKTCHDVSKKRKIDWIGPVNPHLASGTWKLNREQGSKLLASRFKEDSLYISDWPGCVHAEKKRHYMLFRGLFKNFRRSRVWRTINDSNRGKIEQLNCAFCACNQIWDLHSAFCLKTVFGFHDDGEPVVRAYVCENGHVSGAWTERPVH